MSRGHGADPRADPPPARKVVGPAGTIEEALNLLDDQPIDRALLDASTWAAGRSPRWPAPWPPPHPVRLSDRLPGARRRRRPGAAQARRPQRPAGRPGAGNASGRAIGNLA
ncbi:hypothetical protein ACRAWD_28130 [Caulobacter segnis]